MRRLLNRLLFWRSMHPLDDECMGCRICDPHWDWPEDGGW